MAPDPIASSSPINYSIERAANWILSQVHSEGWFPFAQIGEKSISGSWCTAQAIAALMHTDRIDIGPIAKKTISWLGSQKTGKGWSAMVIGEPLIESTSWVLLALLHAQKTGLVSEVIGKSIEEGISWLLDCQNKDGGWGSWKNDISRTTASSMACEVLVQENFHRKELKRAETYLKNAQNEDGGWGFRKGEKSNIVGSSMALSALSRVSSEKAVIDLGREFVESEQNTGGTFADGLFIDETIGREDGILRWQYFHLPVVLFSLAVSGKSNSITLYRGLSKMLDLQLNSGAWINSNEPQICYHTYVALYYFLKTVKLINIENFLEFSRIIKDYRTSGSRYRILAQENQLHQEIIQNALIIGQDFRLAAGRQSTYYYNLKELLLDPKVINIIANLIWEMSVDIQANAIGGPETGAIPIAIAVAEKSLPSETSLRAFFIRKQPKGHGTRAFIEGPLKKGDRVILVDDVTTSGDSIKNAIDRVEKLGCDIVRIYSIVDREEGATENLGKYASIFRPLFKHSDVKTLVNTST